jgi:hypothetical protein
VSSWFIGMPASPPAPGHARTRTGALAPQGTAHPKGRPFPAPTAAAPPPPGSRRPHVCALRAGPGSGQGELAKVDAVASAPARGGQCGTQGRRSGAN